jgi:hypothetical protein
LVTVKQDIRHHSQCSADLLVIFQSDYDSVHGLVFLGEHLLHEAHMSLGAETPPMSISISSA